MSTAKNSSKKSQAKATAAKAPAKAAQTEAPVAETVAKKESRSKHQIALDSIAKIRSTGNEQIDKAARKVITAIFEKDLIMEGSEAEGYTGTFNEIEIKCSKKVMESKKEGKKATSRYTFEIGDKVSIGGQFAYKAFSRCVKQNNHETSVPAFNEESVASIAALLD